MKPISGKRLCRVLQLRGWVLVRTKGSHYLIQHPNRRQTIIVPVHGNRDLRRGTQHSIMKDAELSEQDL